MARGLDKYPLTPWEVESENVYKDWEAGGSIGPNPRRVNSPPSVHIKRFFNHERWLRSEGRIGERLVLQTKNFGHIDLDGANLSGAIFANVTFSHTNLRETSFKGAKLYGVTFYYCDLDKTDFTGATGQQVSFENSNPEKANFGEGRTGIEESSPDRSEIKFVGRAKAKYHSL
jgi:hypothetical protein